MLGLFIRGPLLTYRNNKYVGVLEVVRVMLTWAIACTTPPMPCRSHSAAAPGLLGRRTQRACLHRLPILPLER